MDFGLNGAAGEYGEVSKTDSKTWKRREQQANNTFLASAAVGAGGVVGGNRLRRAGETRVGSPQRARGTWGRGPAPTNRVSSTPHTGRPRTPKGDFGRLYKMPNVQTAERMVSAGRKLRAAGGAATGVALGSAVAGDIAANNRRRAYAREHRARKATVSKKQFDSERSRRKRLENYQTAAHVGGGIAAGAGAAAGAGRVGGRLKMINRSGQKLGNLPAKNVLKVVNPGGKATVATLGGIGAIAAGDAINRYRKKGGRSYQPLR